MFKKFVKENIKVERNSSYRNGYADAQKDILKALINIITAVGNYPHDNSALLSRFYNTGYGDIIEFKLYKGAKPIRLVSIAYPECLNNPNVLAYSLNKIYEELKGDKENGGSKNV